MLRFNVKNGLKVQQLAKKPSMLKMLMQKILVKHFFNFKFAEAKFLHNFLVQLNCIQQYLGQILVTIEKLLILQIVAFMTGLSKRKLLSNYWATFNLVNVNLLGNPNVNPKNGVAYKKNVWVPNSQNFWGLSPEPHWRPSEQVTKFSKTNMFDKLCLLFSYTCQGKLVQISLN